MVANRSDDTHDDRLIAEANAVEFFRDSIEDALARQNIEASEHTVYYIVNLLAGFVRSDRFFDRTSEGIELKALALIFNQAINAPSSADRSMALKRLGDIALFLTGFFSCSLTRKTVGIDYYIGMGGNAYSALSDIVRRSANGGVFGDIFDELAVKFVYFVDVLAEVSEKSRVASNQDILRLYDMWIRTKSKRAQGVLQDLGIHPTDSAHSRFQH